MVTEKKWLPTYNSHNCVSNIIMNITVYCVRLTARIVGCSDLELEISEQRTLENA